MATENKKTQAKIVVLRSRAQLRAAETFVGDYTEDKIYQVSERLSNLEAVWKAFDAAQLKVETLEEDEHQLTELFDARNEFYNRYCETKAFLTSKQQLVEGSVDEADTGKIGTMANLRLPKLDLPTFDGSTTDWISFKDRFVSMIDEAEHMPLVMKLQYLLSVLKGEVAKRFQHVQLTADNYKATWKALLDRYDNKRALKREYFKALYYIPPMKGESIEELRRVCDEFTRLTQGMSALRESIHQWDTPLCNLLFYKLDSKTLLAWEEHSSKDEEDVFTKLQEFLQRRIRILSATAQSTPEAQRPSPSKVAGTKQHKGVACVSAMPNLTTPIRCFACTQPHYLHQCDTFKEMPVAQREDVITSNKLCRNCFRVGHIALRCISKFKCHKCHQRHHTLLHVDPVIPNPTPNNIVATTTAASGSTIVLLQTALVQVVDDNGSVFDARALLDSGSMSNFISTALANRLTNRKRPASVSILGIGQRENHIQQSVDVVVSSKTQRFNTRLNFLVLDSPTAQLPTLEVNTNEWRIEGLILADPLFYKPGEIDLVIGGEAFWAVHTNERIGGGSGKPVFVNTKFGWTVAGSTTATSQNRHVSTNAVVCQDTLESTIRRFWELDTLPSSSSAVIDEDPCETFFSETTSCNSEGKFEVRLPTIEHSNIRLGHSKAIAERRFFNTERRLQKNPEMYDQYRAFLKEYEELGHMVLLEEPVDDTIVHCYLPHHPVLKESSTTTKVRVVFDASCKTTSGCSLNDVLKVGPTVQSDLFSLILQFRTYPVAISGDIEKMYRQVMVHVDDQPLQRIVWRPNAAEEVRSYQLKTVTYGTACAPFLATRALKQIALNEMEKYPIAADAIKNNFYVDDFLCGATDEESAAELQRTVTKLLRQYGFVLRKWASNSKRVLENIDETDLASPRCHMLGNDPAITTLGLIWYPGRDQFSYQFKHIALPSNVTKRTLLSSVAKIFDPLGLVGPVVCKAKLLMQQAWTTIDPATDKPIDWDTKLPTKLQNAWRSFQQTIHLLENLQIPRYIFGNGITDECELHIFGDASERAYGSCCYIRIISESNITTSLLVAKSKLAPVKSHHSIAKLELCAALLSVQLMGKVSNALRTNPTKITFWSDSTTVLHWLNATPCRWKTFVANRTTQILDVTNIHQWRHVAGIDNPADYISRGLDPTDLLDADRWWAGPSWLSLPETHWPASQFQPLEDAEIIEERRNTTMIALAAVASTFCDELFTKYSSLSKLMRIVAYCCRLVAKARNRRGEECAIEFPEDRNPKWLSTADLRMAELKLCLLHQQQMFPDELHALTTGKAIPRSSQLRWVRPILGKDGLIRVGGRLNLANLPSSVKNPVILSAKHRLTSMIVESCHREQLHAGPEHMLATLRQRFWIIGARNLIRSVYHRCITCFKKRPEFVTQTIADLPSSRVVPAPPFAISGVDYCGPFYVKSGTRKATPRKVYIAIFVCFATRAVHIEVVSDLTTHAFIAALQRFISRRGKVKELHSDNGTAFKGAANRLHQLYVLLKSDAKSREMIFNWCAANEIVWKFIPPRAPHFGGLWEAAVKSAKKHLLKELGSSPLLYEDFLTLCARVEMCLNSRPLTPIPNSPDDLDVLTPGHFLTGSNFQHVPEVDLTKVPDNRLKHWEATQKLVQSIWARWYPEYLQQLQARATKVCKPPVKIETGRVVILKEDNIPPGQWPLAKITAEHPGKDNIVRVVSLRTADGKTITRPVVRIALLPINA